MTDAITGLRSGVDVCMFVRPRWKRLARREGLRLRAGARDLSRPCLLTVAALSLTLGCSMLFLLAPGLDLAVSAAFHQRGAGFPLAADDALRALRRSSTWVMGSVLVAVLIAAFGRREWTAGWGEGRRRRGLCLLAAFALGPGLLVNGLLKGVWGRARPVNVVEFGGDDPFAAAWKFSDGCLSNCSFTSGEASSAAWTVIAALALMPRSWRPVGGAAILIYGLALSLNRVAFGGHFLSDVVLSWLLTLLTAILIGRLMRTAPGALPVRSSVRGLATA